MTDAEHEIELLNHAAELRVAQSEVLRIAAILDGADKRASTRADAEAGSDVSRWAMRAGSLAGCTLEAAAQLRSLARLIRPPASPKPAVTVDKVTP